MAVALTPCPSPQETLKVCLHPHIMMFYLMFMVPEAPLTPSPVTPCPSPQETLKVCLHPPIMMFHPIFMVFHPMFMVPCPQARLTPSPLTPCPNPKSPNPLSQPPGNFKGVYVHGPVAPRPPLTPSPLTPCPNPKSPNPLSQPPGNPKGVLVPKHHDVPPTHYFFLFFKGCIATSDVILASHL